MVQGTINRQIIIDYLLGTIPEADQFTLAERFSSDEELFDQLKAVEADLMDQYVHGQLGPEEARRLEGYLYHLPGGRHKLGVAQALMKVAAEQRPAAATELQPIAWWRSMLSPAGKTQPWPVYSLVAALIVSMIAVIWLVNNNRRLRQQNEKLFTQVEQYKTEIQSLEQRLATDPKQPREQLSPPLKPQRDSGSGNVETPPITGRNVPAPATATLWLTLSLRGSSNPVELIMEPNTTTVMLIAPVEGRETYTGYRVRIQSAEGEGDVILDKQLLHSPGKNIEIRLEASRLPPATYRLTLELKTADAVGIFRDYYFTTVKKQTP